MTRPLAFAALALGLFATLVGVETLRSPEPFQWSEFAGDLLETGLLVGAVFAAALVSLELRDLRLERRDLLGDLADARREGEAWRARARLHLDGLSKAMATQFQKWNLTPAEADVAALMLKGLSHRDIASLRESKEATVRQHAAAIYRKSGTTSRAQLTGFFFEDLLAPASEHRPAQPLSIVRNSGD